MKDVSSETRQNKMLLLLAVLVCSFCFRILLADSLPHCAQHRTVPSIAATPKPDSQRQIPMSVKDGDFLVEIAMAQPTLFPLRAPPCAAGLGGYIYTYIDCTCIASSSEELANQTLQATKPAVGSHALRADQLFKYIKWVELMEPSNARGSTVNIA